MRSHIAGCWPVGIPNVITHSDAVQKIASAQPAGYNHPPCPIRNDLPDTDALMSKSSRKPDVVRHRLWLGFGHRGCRAGTGKGDFGCDRFRVVLPDGVHQGSSWGSSTPSLGIVRQRRLPHPRASAAVRSSVVSGDFASGRHLSKSWKALPGKEILDSL